MLRVQLNSLDPGYRDGTSPLLGSHKLGLNDAVVHGVPDNVELLQQVGLPLHSPAQLNVPECLVVSLRLLDKLGLYCLQEAWGHNKQMFFSSNIW